MNRSHKEEEKNTEVLISFTNQQWLRESSSPFTWCFFTSASFCYQSISINASQLNPQQRFPRDQSICHVSLHHLHRNYTTPSNIKTCFCSNKNKFVFSRTVVTNEQCKCKVCASQKQPQIEEPIRDFETVQLIMCLTSCFLIKNI